MDPTQETAIDLSPEAGGAANRRDRKQICERRQHSLNYHQNYLAPCWFLTPVCNSDPSSSQSPRQPMPRNKSSRSAGKRKLKTTQEKMDAIGRVHSGESKAAVARDIGVPESTLRGWCKVEDKIRNQLNNVRGSATYESILTFGSLDNSHNSRPRFSRSTPPTQNTMEIPTSGAAKRPSEESEGLALKRAKIENNLTSSAAVAAAAAINMNSIPTSTQQNDTIFNPYLYLFTNDLNKSDTQQLLDSSYIATLSSLMAQGDLLLPYPGYAPITNLLTADTRAQLHRNNMCNMRELISNNTINNNNVDHVDNETTIRRSPQELPPEFAEMISSCSQLVDWLGMYGTPICTFMQMKHVKEVLSNMTQWKNQVGSIESQRTIIELTEAAEKLSK